MFLEFWHLQHLCHILMNTSIKYIKKHTPGRSFKVIKKHHELVYKEFQEEIKQEQGKCYLSEQL